MNKVMTATENSYSVFESWKKLNKILLEMLHLK